MKPILSVAGLSLLLVLATLDPAGNLPWAAEGPGLTVDESFNVEVGTFLVRAEASYGLAALSVQSQQEIFAQSLNDHPPLGRGCLGLANVLIDAVLPVRGGDPRLGTAAAARAAPAVAFALTVLLVGWVVRRWSGDEAGFWAALVLATTPRVFGHAHIASLETFIGLAYAVTVLATAQAWGRKITARRGLACGVLWGLTLLTKIQAVLLPVPVGLWALWYYRGKAIAPLACFAFAGLLTFFVGWPYLWNDPVGHFVEYFGRAGDRITLHVFFAGERYADRTVPVLYAPVMFLLTQPAAWLIGGLTGLWTLRRPAVEETEHRRRWRLVAASAVFPVLFFAAPNFATYDGVRLFLVAYPLWACVCGLGLFELRARLCKHVTRLSAARIGGVAGVVAVALLLVQRPLWLSHYNLFVGGTRGAAALGMEPTYWADSLTETFWEEVAAAVPEGEAIAVTPVLHQFQLPYLQGQSTAGGRLALQPWTPDTEARYLVAFRRRADLPAELSDVFARKPLAVVRTWDGVAVATLVTLPPR